MKFKYFVSTLIFTALLFSGIQTFAQSISDKEEARLKSFIKKRFGARMPGDSQVDVKGYEKSPIEGFKKGSFSIQSARGSGDIPFLISEDGKYIVLGEPTSVRNLEKTPVKGLRKGTVSLRGQEVSVLATVNKKYLIFGDLLDTTVDPTKETMSKISLDNVPYRGAKDAEVTIVEYSDFQCPFCKQAHEALPQILEEYEGKVKLVYKQLPLSNHPWAMSAAIASICAYKQGNGNFWEFHDLVFENQEQITVQNSNDQFRDLANKIGLDTPKFNKCLDSKEVAQRVQSHITEAQSVGANSTPTFIVNGITVRGANTEGLKSAIETSLSE